MDSAAVHAFSRMGDAPQYRGEIRENTKEDVRNNFMNVNISQWGIGAKAAGFYLGERIVVTSRQASSNLVLQVGMSSKRMFEAHKLKGNAFQDQLINRSVGDVHAARMAYGSEAGGLHAYLRAEIKELERTYPHFTCIAVSGIEHRHLAHLSSPADHVLLKHELANIYNRFLHGPMGLNAGEANRDKQWISPDIIVEYVRETDNGESASMVQRVNLRDVTENEASVFQLRRRGETLRFRMEVDPPPAGTIAAEAGIGGQKAIINGELYYLPRGVDGETHPDLQIPKQADGAPTEEKGDDDSTVAAAPASKRPRVPGTRVREALAPTSGTVPASAGASAAASASVAAAAAHGEALDTQRRENVVFDLYWHGRLPSGTRGAAALARRLPPARSPERARRGTTERDETENERGRGSAEGYCGLLPLLPARRCGSPLGCASQRSGLERTAQAERQGESSTAQRAGSNGSRRTGCRPHEDERTVRRPAPVEWIHGGSRLTGGRSGLRTQDEQSREGKGREGKRKPR
jgi:hypothetical protein